MKIVGLTGGIGSGKSTVANIFKELGVPVFNSDDEAKKLYYSSLKLKEQVIDLFGAEAYLKDELNKKYLAEKVFGDKSLLQKLNGLVHPLVKEAFLQWCNQFREHHYVLKEAAIIFESGSYKSCDAVISVEAPVELRISRVMKRDFSSKEQVQQRIEKQFSEAERRALADYIIENNGTKSLIHQVLEIHQKLILL